MAQLVLLLPVQAYSAVVVWVYFLHEDVYSPDVVFAVADHVEDVRLLAFDYYRADDFCYLYLTHVEHSVHHAQACQEMKLHGVWQFPQSCDYLFPEWQKS